MVDDAKRVIPMDMVVASIVIVITISSSRLDTVGS